MPAVQKPFAAQALVVGRNPEVSHRATSVGHKREAYAAEPGDDLDPGGNIVGVEGADHHRNAPVRDAVVQQKLESGNLLFRPDRRPRARTALRRLGGNGGGLSITKYPSLLAANLG
ncbi:MAG: hypothetical protein COT91_00775 [Candidatus Doudnabacteria bacterium CG10_big_fil_rev_8_21_14_0_10_41_10]|uniref:Uncharacterized protein n=1 Tax=Candidatus Doudnabacteria bacterium CG10_big_fil_rev_8_21_14_0_10_41_10 TaxID=1974551 RepID=A0A2H0VEN3_9BACT|nr:MAG: hypothetical protein COT91_00775 [Candidatus Doudnabacteria bacterium CG10_big_fil_rev_8_21_14_0_10_41_10]